MTDTKLIRGSGGGGGKDGGGAGRAPIESPDTLRSQQIARVLDLISEGEIGGLVDGLRSVYLNDTPIQNANGSYNFQSVVFDSRTGTQSQDPISGFNAAESETPVGAEVKQATSVTRTISNVNNTAVRVTLSIPQLTLQDTSTGDLGGSSVEVAIDVQNDGAGFVPQPLRKIFSSASFALGAISRNTIASTRINITVAWTGQSVQSPQTCTCKLQYRAYGDSTWLDYATHTFQSTASVYANPLQTQSNPLQTQTNPLGPVTVFPGGTKTFNLTLAEDEYEFRVVKVTGTVQGAFGVIQSGPAYGGAVAISYGEVYGPAYTDVISGKTTSKYQRDYIITLPAGGPWDIRVRRITADSAQTVLQNKTFWDSYTEIIDGKLSYPNSAIAGLQIDAKQFNAIPTRGYEIYGIKVQIPDNYDPLTREYTGTWGGSFSVAWTDNPAWIFYDILTNERYGLGERISADQVDKWALYEIAQYCDEMVEDGFGGIEPRFTCNLYLQTREEAYRVVDNIASIFRGMTYWAAGAMHVSQDAPADAVQQFTPANVIDGAFSYSGSSGKVRHTVALIAWNDPQDAYRQKVEYVEDAAGIARYGVVQTEIQAIGCTSRGQAHRLGRWLLYTEQNETETISFRAGMDSVFLSPGDIIRTQDPVRAGARMGGRLVSATVSSVELDAAITLDNSTYTLSCVLPDGTLEERTVTNAPGSTASITVSPDFSQAPQAYSIWTMYSDNLVTESWRVISIAESEKAILEISALAYRADKYDAVEQNLILEPLPTSLNSALQPATPTNLQVTESLYLSGLSVVAVSATVSWSAAAGASSYSLTYQLENQNPVTIDNIKGTTVDIKPLVEGNYTFTLYAVNIIGRRSQANTLTQTIYGKTTSPADVSNFQLVALSGYAHLTWDPASDLDVTVGGYLRIRYTSELVSPSWTGAVNIGPQVPGTATNTTLPLMTGSYLAKWVDSSGNESDTAAIISSNVANLLTMNALATLTESPSFAGSKTNVAYDAGRGGLKLTPRSLISEWPLLSTLGYLSAEGGINSTGEYLFDQSLDLGSVQTSRLSANLDVLAFNANDLISQRGLISTWPKISGDGVTDVGVTLSVRTTNDDPAGTPTWSAWQPFFVGDWTARAFEFKADLFSEDDTHNLVLKTLAVTVDMPDRDEYGEDIISGTSPYTVTYAVPFKVPPALGITEQNMQTGDYKEITDKDEYGFTIVFKNSGGTIVSRTFDYHAKAY